MEVRQYRLTFIGLAAAVGLLAVSLFLDLDLFEGIVSLFAAFDRYEVDELVLAVFVFLVFAVADQFRRRRAQQLELEKLKIYKAMLFSTHHILNNFLNQMLIVKLAADDTPGFDPAVIALYEQIIRETSAQLATLGNLTRIDAEEIRAAVEPRQAE